MKTLTVDVAIIGAGTAGLAAYRAARARGARAVIIESGPYGTTCARVGCMPSKLLIAAAEASHAIDDAPGFGVHVDGAKRIDGREVMDRVRRERDRFVGFVVEGVENMPAADRVVGKARFVDRNTLAVGDETRITARAVVVATGSRPAVPAMLEGAGDRLIVNDDVFSWETLPRSVAIFGPGVIGLELGQALARLGVRVVVLGRGGRVGPLTDPVVRDAALKAIGAELYVDPDARVSRVARITEGVEVDYTRLDGSARTESFDYVLAATGRRPNVDGLGLESLGLELDEAGVPRFDPATMRVGDTNVFIAGDASNFIPVLHEAADEGRIAGENAARFPAVEPGKRRAPLAVVFTDPQIAIVGGGYAGLAPDTFEAGDVSFDDQGRSRIIRKNRGHLRVYADRATGRFLGAEMAGPSAEHIGHLLAWAAATRMTVASMLEMPFYHPVVEEGLRTALRDLDAKLRTPQAIAA
jgi:dihydrolipoamide dehydrogenase